MVFIAIQLKSLHNYPAISKSVDLIIEDLHNSVPENEDSKIRYPGENVLVIKNENLKNGIPVRKDIWERIKKL